jgi:hypothetical protein
VADDGRAPEPRQGGAQQEPVHLRDLGRERPGDIGTAAQALQGTGAHQSGQFVVGPAGVEG